MDDETNRNTIIFMVCAVVLLLAYQMFVTEPALRKRQVEQHAQQVAQAAAQAHAPVSAGGFVPVAQAASASPRVKLDTPSLTGSINLRGARIDDLSLKHYRQQTDPRYKPDPKAPLVEMFRPEGAEHAWFAELGWSGANAAALPNGATPWTAQPGAVLTPQTPLALTWDNGQGLKFARTIAVDANYMFTITDKVTNTSAAPVSLQSYGSVQQRGMPGDLASSSIVHEGAIGMLGGHLELDPYRKGLFTKAWKDRGVISQDSTGGWMGITEKYWLSALIPDQSEAIGGQFRVQPVSGVDAYEAGFVGPMQTVAPGATISQTTRLFAGAKVVPLLRGYESALSIPRFDQAVDWGHFYFFTQPLFSLLEVFNHTFGNIGLSILALTVLVKLIFFPLANKSYESITKMKKIQPQVELLKKQHGQDAAKLQQETMALYQREKINPLMGCLPMLIQIPVFFSLYKVLSVTIEMRQAPFFGWVHDLSQRDPTTIWNLFGVIPWDPSHAPFIGVLLNQQLHIGLWPLLYGCTMWLTQQMSPPAADPAQQRIFAFMPVIFTFTLAQFTVGLLIYWCWSNVLSILQQYVIMHRFKVDNPIDSFIGRFVKPKPAG